MLMVLDRMLVAWKQDAVDAGEESVGLMWERSWVIRDMMLVMLAMLDRRLVVLGIRNRSCDVG